jgi:hypothetical protein
MSPQNHQKGNLMFTLPKSDILHFNQSQVQNRHKVHRTKEQITFPHVLRRLNTWGTPPKVYKSTPTILLLYVDDLFLTGEEKLITECKKRLASEFEMKDLGLMHYLLGLEVWQSHERIFVNQGKYTVEIFDMLNTSP